MSSIKPLLGQIQEGVQVVWSPQLRKNFAYNKYVPFLTRTSVGTGKHH